MNHFKDYYDKHVYDIHETDLNSALNILEKHINSVGEGNILSNVSSFLDMEEIQTFMKDSLKYYVYKKVFNMALLLFNEDKKNYKDDLNIFIEQFQDRYKKIYTFHDMDEENLLILAKDMYKLVQSPEKSRKDKFISDLRDYAEKNEINICYLCGNTVNFNKNYSISLYDAIQSELDTKIKKKLEDHQHHISKSLKKMKFTSNKYRFKLKKNIYNSDKIDISHFEKEYYKFTNLNDLNSIFTASNFKLNSNNCEIEHNFPAAWGGDLSSENIFVACHKCNNVKGDIAFYTDIDYSNIFSNSKDITKIRKKITAKTKIAIKIKQKFSCKSDNCSNKLGTGKTFHLINENLEYGLSFFNLSMYCEECIEVYASAND